MKGEIKKEEKIKEIKLKSMMKKMAHRKKKKVATGRVKPKVTIHS